MSALSAGLLNALLVINRRPWTSIALTAIMIISIWIVGGTQEPAPKPNERIPPSRTPASSPSPSGSDGAATVSLPRTPPTAADESHQASDPMTSAPTPTKVPKTSGDVVPSREKRRTSGPSIRSEAKAQTPPDATQPPSPEVEQTRAALREKQRLLTGCNQYDNPETRITYSNCVSRYAEDIERLQKILQSLDAE